MTKHIVYTVIDDGGFVYPVETAALLAAGKTEADVRAMSGDEYSTWCREVPMITEARVGTQACIDLCERLIEAGADTWNLA